MASSLVTIGLPVYNSQRFLRQSLDSLLAQTFSDFVLVISDNASTDGTAGICREYAAKDRRIRYYRNDTNIGNPRNFNRVASLVETPYLKWSTSDDYWAPTFLERALEVMERDSSIALCYPRATLVDEEGRNAKKYDDALHLMQDDPADRFEALLKGIRLAHQHLGLIRMNCLKQTHMLGDYLASDINLLAELTLYGKYFELPDRLFFRRFHPDSGSWDTDDPEHDARTYLAAGEKKSGLMAWRRHTGFFAAVRSSPLTIRSKMRLYKYLTRRMIWSRRELAAGLSEYARMLLSRSPSRPTTS